MTFSKHWRAEVLWCQGPNPNFLMTFLIIYPKISIYTLYCCEKFLSVVAIISDDLSYSVFSHLHQNRYPLPAGCPGPSHSPHPGCTPLSVSDHHLKKPITCTTGWLYYWTSKRGSVGPYFYVLYDYNSLSNADGSKYVLCRRQRIQNSGGKYSLS